MGNIVFTPVTTAIVGCDDNVSPAGETSVGAVGGDGGERAGVQSYLPTKRHDYRFNKAISIRDNKHPIPSKTIHHCVEIRSFEGQPPRHHCAVQHQQG